MHRTTRPSGVVGTVALTLTVITLAIGVGLSSGAGAQSAPTPDRVEPALTVPAPDQEDPVPTVPATSSTTAPPAAPPSTTTALTTPPTEAPSPPTTAAPPHTTTPAARVEVVRPTAPAVVGDSLTFSARALMPQSWRVDAENGRALFEAESFAFLAAVPAQSGCVVIALGSNDVSHERSERQMVADVTHANRLLRAHRCVVWTTVKVDGVTPMYSAHWRRYAMQWNRVIRTTGAGSVLNWNAVAAAHPEYFLGDGLHMVRQGRVAYASFLRTGARNAMAPIGEPE